MTEQGRSEATRSGDRPRSHAGTSDTELAIFQATERLLGEIPLHELSVAQIIGAAEISRATFYFYFSSKFAVLSGLLARVMEEIFEVVQPFVRRQDGISAELDREREAGIAPPGVASRQLAAVLLWATERCLYVSGLGVPDLADEEQTLEPLVALWAGTLYGGRSGG